MMDSKIKELYLNKGFSQSQIANTLNIPVHKVQYVIDKNKWKKEKVEPIDKDTLSFLLLDSLLSKNEIAKRFNISPSVVTRLIKKYEIRSLTKEEKGKMREKSSGTKKYEITEKELKELFINQNKTISECALHYNTSEGNVKRLLAKFNITKDRVDVSKRTQEKQKERYGGTGFQLWEKGSYPFQNLEWQRNAWIRKNSQIKIYINKYEDLLSIIKSFDKKPSIQEIAIKTGYGESSIGKFISFYGLRDLVKINESYFERVVEDFLIKNNIKYKRRDRKIIAPKELDFVVEDKKVAIEVNDNATHGENYHSRNYHLQKTQECREKGYNLIHVFQWELDHIEIILSSLLETSSIYARKTIVKEISSSVAQSFLNTYHRQGAGLSASYNIGLFYKDELVQVMNFRASRNKAKAEIELFRLCSKSRVRVVGGASKLFSFFLKNNPDVKNIISYCDLAHNSGGVYGKLGFILSHTSAPNYKWVDSSGRVFSRESTMKHKLVEQGFDINLSEKEIMESRGFKRIFDSGNQIWYYNNIR